MNYKEKKRSMFLGLPWTFTSYTITDGLGTVHCFTGDVTDPDLKLIHIKHAKEIKDYILRQSEQERLKRKTLNTQHLDGNPSLGEMADTDSCK